MPDCDWGFHRIGWRSFIGLINETTATSKESIDLAATAAADLAQARRTGTYPDYNRALFGFEEALRQWPANTRAAAGLTETRGTYAESAFQHGDYDLALSLLEPIANDDSRRAGGRQPPTMHSGEPESVSSRTNRELQTQSGG